MPVDRTGDLTGSFANHRIEATQHMKSKLLHDSKRTLALLLALLIPLLSTACGTLEVRIESAPGVAADSGMTEEPAAIEPTSHVAMMTPTPTPADYVPPTPEPPLAPVPVGDFAVPAALRVVWLQDGNVWQWTEESAAAVPLTSGGGLSGVVKISDDGQLVAFTRGEASELWTIRADGTDERQIVSADDLNGMQPSGLDVRLHQLAWIPGTHRLVFNTRLQMEIGLVLNDDLHLVDHDTLERTTLLPPGQGGEFVSSPDGRQIAVITPGSIRLMQADGSELREVFTYTPVTTYSEFRFYAQPAWAADSSFLRVAIPPADPQAATGQSTTIWHLPTDGGQARLLASVDAVSPTEGMLAFSSDLEYLAFIKSPAAIDASGATGNGSLRVRRLSNEDWMGNAEAVAVYGWAPNSNRFAFLAGHQAPYLYIAQWSGRSFPGTVQAGTPVHNVRWVDADHYLLLAGTGQAASRGANRWDLVLANVDGASTILASGIETASFDFTSP